MFHSVDYIRELCKQRNIPISTLEAACGFANGYLNPKKLKKLPYDRAVKIAEYLDISVDILLTGKEKAPAPEGEREIGFDDFTYAMQNEAKELTDEDKEVLLSMARQLRAARSKNENK